MPPDKSLQRTGPQLGAIDWCSLLASITELERASHRADRSAPGRWVARANIGVPETYPLVAELALGLAGFTGVLVVLGRQPGRFSPAEAFRLSVLLAGAISALFLSLVPMVLADLGLDGPSLWRMTSIIASACLATTALLLRRPLHAFRQAGSDAYSPLVLYGLGIGAILAFCLQLANAVGWPWSPSPGPISVALIYLLTGGVVQFVRILFVRSDSLSC